MYGIEPEVLAGKCQSPIRVLTQSAPSMASGSERNRPFQHSDNLTSGLGQHHRLGLSGRSEQPSPTRPEAPAPRPVPPIRYNRTFMLRYFTARESHGEALVAFLSGLPAGLMVDP